MKGYTPTADVLVPLFDPTTPFDRRKAAVTTFASEAWCAGWNACAEELTTLVEAHPEATKEDVVALLKAARS